MEMEEPEVPQHVSPNEAKKAYYSIWVHRDNMLDDVDREESSKFDYCNEYKPKNAKKDKHKIFGIESPFANITILEVCGHRDLYTNNNIQSSELDEFIYHEALVHPAMAAFQHFHGSPARRIFVGGGGEGSIAREALRWPKLEEVKTVDIDKVLVDTIREWIPGMAGKAHDDPRSKVVIGDAVVELNAAENASYDIFIKDLPDPLEMQAAKSFFSAEFYRTIKSKLVKGGILVDSSGPCNIQTRRKFDGRQEIAEDVGGFLLIYGTLSTVFKHVDVMHFPMSTWFGNTHMYCVFLASDAGFPAGLIPAAAIDDILPVPGASPQAINVSASTRAGLGFYNGELHSLSFKKSKAASDALHEAAVDAFETDTIEDDLLERIEMDASKSVEL